MKVCWHVPEATRGVGREIRGAASAQETDIHAPEFLEEGVGEQSQPPASPCGCVCSACEMTGSACQGHPLACPCVLLNTGLLELNLASSSENTYFQTRPVSVL